jgi:hypothetical protein
MADVKNLNEFYSILRARGARLNHQFQMQVISNVGSVDDALSDITMWAAGSELPSRTLNVADIAYMGYTLGVPSNVEMSRTLELTIRCDRDMEVRNAFLAWQKVFASIVIGSELDNGGGDKSIPDGRVELFLLEENMKTVEETYVLAGAFPTEVGTMELSNEDPTIATFSVTLQFQYWYNENQPGI